MALTKATAGLLLPKTVSGEIWDRAREGSFVMQRGTQISMPANGVQIQEITGGATAKWVGEGQRKLNTDLTYSNSTFQAYKAALTISFSDEFLRDLPALYDKVKPELATALTDLFDAAVLHNLNVPGANFSTLASAQVATFGKPNATTIAGATYDEAVAAYIKAATANTQPNGWFLTPKAAASLLTTKDSQGQPLFIQSVNTQNSVGSLLALPVWTGNHAGNLSTTAADTVGFLGDFSQLEWGFVEGISYELYDGPIFDAAGNLIHAGRQDNMRAMIAEFTIGSRIRRPGEFVRLVEGAAGTPETADTP